jgi:monofunctional glycosyltransferase
MSKTGSKIKIWCIRIALTFFISSISFVIIYRFIPIPVTPLMIFRLGDQLIDGKKMKLDKDWESLDNLSKNLPIAVIASEDQKFLDHNGFDFEAMQKAFKSNRKGKKIKGGSTISQQVAKNVFLWQGRSYVRKALEAYFTVLIEIFWPKERIMEVYLNVIEMGVGVYGAEAASQYYYKKPASKLTKNQAAWIATILPCPLKYDPNRPSAYLTKRHARVLVEMQFIKTVDFE